jgi:hypothetical protein
MAEPLRGYPARGVLSQHKVRPGLLLAPCWCEQRLDYLDVDDVLNGRTFSCGLPECHPPHGDLDTLLGIA